MQTPSTSTLEKRSSRTLLSLRQEIFQKWKVFFFFVFIIATLVAFRSSCYELYYIHSSSMVPTLFPGDIVIVKKFAYDLMLPFTDTTLRPRYLKKNYHPILLGDIVLFRFNDEMNFFIKRVVAKGPDKVFMRNKVLFFNENPLTQKCQTVDLSSSSFLIPFLTGNSFLTQCEEMLESHRFFVYFDPENTFMTNFPLTSVSKNHLFLLGDHRDYSYDSRYFGEIEETMVRGKVILVLFSFNKDLFLKEKKIPWNRWWTKPH